MHPEVNSYEAPLHSEVNSVVLLNIGKFNAAMMVLRVPETDAARGRFLGMDAKSVRAALDGKPVGGRFMGQLILTLRRYEELLKRYAIDVDLDTFFQVSELVSA